MTPTKDNYDTKITISASQKSTTNNGVFEGWGTALCWWANRIGYSDELAQKAADLFYGQDGLQFNIMRYNIGGGDDPSHHHITRTDSEVPGWLVLDETGKPKYVYDADYNQLNVLKRCYENAGKTAYVEAFSNSAPYFMTISGCASGASDKTNNENLKEECYGEFAKYLADVCLYMNNEMGIHIDAISPMNEPNPTTGYWRALSPKQEGCHVAPGEHQSAVIVETAKAFDAAGLPNVIVIGCEETSTLHTITSYKSFTPDALKEVDRVSTHTYDTAKIKELGALRQEEGFNLWMSEVDGGSVSGEKAGEMGCALWMAEKIITDINALSPSAWVMWQVIDNHISKGGHNGNKDSGMPNINGGYWGAAVANHDTGEIVLTQKYYAIGQFTRYIHPGSTLITTGDASTLVAYDAAGKTLTIVAVNTKGKDKDFYFEFDGYRAEGEAAVIRTSGSLKDGESWAELPKVETLGNGLAYTLKGNSITTFVIENVTELEMNR